jgi:hypothetical protein
MRKDIAPATVTLRLQNTRRRNAAGKRSELRSYALDDTCRKGERLQRRVQIILAKVAQDVGRSAVPSVDPLSLAGF